MKTLSLLLALILCVLSIAAFGEAGAGAPEGMPRGAAGEMPQGGPGGNPPDLREGGMGGPGGGPGSAAQPDTYQAVIEAADVREIDGETVASTGTDENAIWVNGGELTLTGSEIVRVSGDSSGGDSASFYGVGAAILATDGTADISGVAIDTDARGGAGIFAWGDAVIAADSCAIRTVQDASGGIHVAGGGTLYASNLDVTTEGGSSAAIRSDRGGGIMVVDGGTYTSGGIGSPAVYVTADITIHGAELTATGSEALCLEGRNSVRLYDCVLSGDMPENEQNDTTWNVILYQSMSGDSEVGKGSFEMVGGKLISNSGGVFYTTNTESSFVISGVEIEAQEGAYLLRAAGNRNSRGWGTAGSNGADCVFTAIDQEMAGDVQWDSISALDLYLLEGSAWSGAFVQDESCAGEGGDGGAVLTIDESSCWIVTGNSALTTLMNAGAIVDQQGNPVTVVLRDGDVAAEGTSEYTVTVEDYFAEADTDGAGSVSEWEDYAV
ncbi:MAG: hypothetical protein IKE30_04180 [Clostridia bacterium]|nr:hypothetical protein [Clostridia bacterium]